MPCHLFMGPNRASDLSAADWYLKHTCKVTNFSCVVIIIVFLSGRNRYKALQFV